MWDAPIWDFYRLMGAVLAANLLTVAFVYALMRYTQLEKQGREKEPGSGRHLGTMLFVFAALAFSALAYGLFDPLLGG